MRGKPYICDNKVILMLLIGWQQQVAGVVKRFDTTLRKKCAKYCCPPFPSIFLRVPLDTTKVYFSGA